MALKEQVLQVLEQGRGQTFSGEELAMRFGVSRAAVWKAINSLKAQGHLIEGVQNKGYRLETNSNLITQSGIAFFMAEKETAPILVFDSIDSTNTYAKSMMDKEIPNGTLIVSSQQTAGRGRFGRFFYSGDGGIYMSIMLRKPFDLQNAQLLTMGAAVCVCQALSQLTEQSFDIKWVNDIYYQNKKVCGILTEAVTDFETNTVQGIVIGIGINAAVNLADVPPELQQKVGSLIQFPIIKNQLIAEIAKKILALQENFNPQTLLHYYRQHCFLIGKEIEFTLQEQCCTGVVQTIDDQGALVVQGSEKQEYRLNSGEVSIKNWL